MVDDSTHTTYAVVGGSDEHRPMVTGVKRVEIDPRLLSSPHSDTRIQRTQKVYKLLLFLRIFHVEINKRKKPET